MEATQMSSMRRKDSNRQADLGISNFLFLFNKCLPITPSQARKKAHKLKAEDFGIELDFILWQRLT